jgi:hypothetical protein
MNFTNFLSKTCTDNDGYVTNPSALIFNSGLMNYSTNTAKKHQARDFALKYLAYHQARSYLKTYVLTNDYWISKGFKTIPISIITKNNKTRITNIINTNIRILYIYVIGMFSGKAIKCRLCNTRIHSFDKHIDNFTKLSDE